MWGRRIKVVAAACMLASAGCQRLFEDDAYLRGNVSEDRVREIETITFAEYGETDDAPMTVDEGADKVLDTLAEPVEAPATIELTIEEVRAASLQNNLDLEVQLVAPSIAATVIDEEEARFEAAFTASIRRTETDSPTALGTEGTMSEITSYALGLELPLRTGGTVNVNLPFSETSTNNPFSLLNPAHNVDLQFSISQPLLRNAGPRTNLHALRVARGRHRIAGAQTKLEAIRILAGADSAYWRLYAARQELEVAYQQYQLAMEQYETAQRRVNAGDLPEIEVVRAESGVAERLQAIIVARSLVRRRQRELKRIINRPDLPIDSPTEVFTATEPSPVWLDLDETALADYALANRMEMLELELQLAIDMSAIDFERNQALPSFVVDYSYNLNGLSNNYGDAFDQIPPSSFSDWSLGLSAEIPLGNEAAKARVHRALLTRLQRLATIEQRRLAITQEVYDALDAAEESWQRILASRHESRLAGRTMEAERRQFDLGLRTSTDVLDAVTRLAEAQSREIRALSDYQISLVDLAFATGTLLGKDRVRWEPAETRDVE